MKAKNLHFNKIFIQKKHIKMFFLPISMLFFKSQHKTTLFYVDFYSLPYYTFIIRSIIMGGKAMVEYFLGIDGGGTKTHCALFSKKGKLVDLIETSTTSHEFLPHGYADLKIVLQTLFNEIQKRNNLQWEKVSLVYGMAGVDCKKQEEDIGSFITEYGIKNIILCNDSFLGIKAGSATGWGICSMNGTGTGAGGITKQGKTHMAGRLFELSGDYAGGKILGEKAISHVYDYLFRGGRKTLLCDLMYTELGVKTKEGFEENLICAIAEKKLESKNFAKFLFIAAQQKDEVALEILSNCGKQNARDIIAVVKELDFPKEESIPIVLLGSLYTKAEHNQILQALAHSLHEANINFELITLESDPVVGAVCWAMEKEGFIFEKNNIHEQINKAKFEKINIS